MTDNNDDLSKAKEAIGEEAFAQLLQYFKSGHLCLADIAKIPMSELENLQRLARQLILRKEYARAVKVMDMIVHLHPHTAEFWGTYGIALQHAENHLKARVAYAMAQRLEPEAMEWPVFGAECELMLQNPQYALDLVKPLFHMKVVKSAKAQEMIRRAQRIKTIAENMASGPNDKPNVEQYIRKNPIHPAPEKLTARTP